MLNWQKEKKPIIALAPMADMTDESFSVICKKLDAPFIFREMVSSEALVRGSKKTLAMARFSEKNRPLVQQIFGANPQVMAKAAKIIEQKFAPDGIDINMGCPAKKIISQNAGADLIKNPELAIKIIKAIKKFIKIPLSVKTRTGWSSAKEILTFASLIEKAGADLITVHGRTKIQGYSGKANWRIIGKVKNILTIPVILNGDIFNADDARRALEETGADGLMIGRGALGNPWIFKQIKDLLNKNIKPKEITLLERKKIALKHAKLHVKHYGLNSLTTFRKHLLLYFKGAAGTKKIRIKLAQIKTYEELEDILRC